MMFMKIHTIFIFHFEHNQVFTFKMLLHCSQIKIWNLKFLKLFFRQASKNVLSDKLWVSLLAWFVFFADCVFQIFSLLGCFRFDVSADLMLLPNEVLHFGRLKTKQTQNDLCYARSNLWMPSCEVETIDWIKMVRNKWILLKKNNDYINH